MRRLILILLWLGLLAPTWVHAESLLEPPSLEEYRRVGPFRLKPSFSIRNFGWDDNILANVNERAGDYTFTLGPRVEGLFRLGDRAFLILDERLEYTVFLSNTEQNYASHKGRARLTVPLQPFGVFAEFRDERTRERPIDLESIRPIRNTYGPRGGLILPLGWRTELELFVGSQNYRYRNPSGEDPLALPRRLNREERELGLNARYQLTGRLDLLLETQQTDIKFSDPGTALSDASQQVWTIGAEVEPGGPLLGEIKLGYKEIDAKDPSGLDFGGVVGSLNAKYLMGELSRIELRAEQKADYATFAEQNFYLTSDAQVDFVHYFNRTIGGEIGIGLASLDFEGSGRDRIDDINRYSVGVRLRLSFPPGTSPAEYILRISRYERNSNIDVFDNENTRVGLDFNFNF